MFGVASGFIMARAHASPSILYAAMERSHTYSSIATLVCCSIARFFLGMVMILGLKTVVGAVSKSLLMYVGGVIGVHTVCIKRQSAVTSERVHYSPAFTVAEEVRNDSFVSRLFFMQLGISLGTRLRDDWVLGWLFAFVSRTPLHLTVC